MLEFSDIRNKCHKLGLGGGGDKSQATNTNHGRKSGVRGSGGLGVRGGGSGVWGLRPRFRGWQSGVHGSEVPGSGVWGSGFGVRSAGLEVGVQRAPRLLASSTWYLSFNRKHLESNHFDLSIQGALSAPCICPLSRWSARLDPGISKMLLCDLHSWIHVYFLGSRVDGLQNPNHRI